LTEEEINFVSNQRAKSLKISEDQARKQIERIQAKTIKGIADKIKEEQMLQHKLQRAIQQAL
jgi:hypothetical protein